MTAAGRRWCEMVTALAGEPLALPPANGKCRRFHKASDAEQVEALLALVFERTPGGNLRGLRAAAGICPAAETDT